MSITTYGWLVLIFPLAGAILIGLTFKALPRASTASSASLAIFLAFLSAVGMLIKLGDRSEESKQVVSVAWDYAKTVGVDAQVSILIDPLSTMMCLVVPASRR
jgi:NADH-quinone oxidoreductase subunit L